MPSLKTIRKRITSVKATQKITRRRMKMVAGARLNRAQQRITALRPYALKTREVLDGVAATMANKQLDHRVQLGRSRRRRPPRCSQRRPERTVLFVVLLRRPRPLAGGFNNERQQGGLPRVEREEGVRRRGDRRDDRQEGAAITSRAARRTSSATFRSTTRGIDLAKAAAVLRLHRLEVPEERDRRGLPRLQRVQEPDDAEAAGRRAPAASRAASAEGRHARAPPSTSSSRRRAPCSSASCRCTSRSRSTARLLETQAGFFGAQMTAMDAATRKREGHDRPPDPPVQPSTSGGDHEGADGDHRRRRSAQRMISGRGSQSASHAGVTGALGDIQMHEEAVPVTAVAPRPAAAASSPELGAGAGAGAGTILDGIDDVGQDNLEELAELIARRSRAARTSGRTGRGFWLESVPLHPR